MKNDQGLPNLLKFYKNSSFVTMQRAKFLFYLCLSLLFTVSLLLALRLYFHPLSNTHDHSHITNLLPLVIIFLLFIVCFVLLIKGYLKTSSVLLPSIVLGVIWFIMIMDQNQIIARLDTVVYVFMVLAMLPLLIQKRNFIILLVAAANIVGVIVFALFFKDKLNLTNVDFWDYIIDNSVTFAFVGFVSFHMNKIYSRAIEQAQTDLQKRIETEKTLIESEAKYSEIMESLPEIVFEIDLNGRVNFINQIGLTKFGYSHDDIGKEILVTDFIVEKEVLLQNIDKNVRGEINSFAYTAIQKDGTTFPIQVYSSAIHKNGNPVGLRGIAIDLTDELKKQKIIHESEERFSAAFMSNPAPMAISEIDTGLFIDVNDKWVQLIGYSRDEHIGRTSQELDYWFDKDDRLKIVKKLKENGFFKNEIVRVKNKSGEAINVRWSVEIITFNEKKVMLSLCIDETEKLKAENEIQQSRELFKTLVESSPISITLSDMNGKFILANNVFSKYAAQAIEFIIGKTAQEIGITTDFDDYKLVLEQFKKDGYVKNFETNVINHKGEKFFMLFSAQIVTFNGQQGILQTSIDISDRRKAELELEHSQKLFKTLIDSNPNSITLIDSDGKYVMVNKAFAKHIKFEISDIVGKTPEELGIEVNPDHKNFILSELYKKGFIDGFEAHVKNTDGQNLIILIFGSIVEVNNTKSILLSTVDITERKHLENELKKYNEQLEFLVKERTEELETSNEELRATNEELYSQREHLSLTLEKLKETQEQLIQTEKMASLGLLTAGVAHEINNPVNYIYNGAIAIENFLVDNSPQNLETLKPLFEAINTGIQRITGIVKSLNKYSRNDESSLASCNVHEIIDNALVMLYNQYKKKIEITKEYSTTPPIVLAREGELHQVFLNIIINAVQAIEDKGTITIKTKVSENEIEISIKDSGVGINPENLKKIFDPFFTTKDPGKGTGLGLSITKKIIQGHKGAIHCYSEPDKGAEFIVTLPKTL